MKNLTSPTTLLAGLLLTTQALAVPEDATIIIPNDESISATQNQKMPPPSKSANQQQSISGSK